MQNCIRCAAPLEEATNFCPRCGTDQRYGYSPGGGSTLLNVLCILTIIGSALQILRGVFYEMVSADSNNDEYIRGWIYGITGLLTLVGAIMMLQKQRNGLYLYTTGQGIYLLTCFWATSVYMDEGEETQLIVLAISSLFVIPAIIFLIIFWTDGCRRVLK